MNNNNNTPRFQYASCRIFCKRYVLPDAYLLAVAGSAIKAWQQSRPLRSKNQLSVQRNAHDALVVIGFCRRTVVFHGDKQRVRFAIRLISLVLTMWMRSPLKKDIVI